MKLIDAAQEAIRLARARRDYWDSELPKRHPDYPLVHLGEDSGPPPPEEEQLRDFLGGLPEETVFGLILLMHLGRGDFPPADLAGPMKELRKTFSSPEDAISQMMGKAPLADYLEDGLAAMVEGGIELDKVRKLKPAQQRKG